MAAMSAKLNALFVKSGKYKNIAPATPESLRRSPAFLKVRTNILCLAVINFYNAWRATPNADFAAVNISPLARQLFGLASDMGINRSDCELTPSTPHADAFLRAYENSRGGTANYHLAKIALLALELAGALGLPTNGEWEFPKDPTDALPLTIDEMTHRAITVSKAIAENFEATGNNGAKFAMRARIQVILDACANVAHNLNIHLQTEIDYLYAKIAMSIPKSDIDNLI